MLKILWVPQIKVAIPADILPEAHNQIVLRISEANDVLFAHFAFTRKQWAIERAAAMLSNLPCSACGIPSAIRRNSRYL